jgi:NADPH:quinone reductase-like Zn-dependent oxidoreductase
VRVYAAGLNPVDTKIRAGALKIIATISVQRIMVLLIAICSCPSRADLAYLASLIDAKKLEVVVNRAFPFAEARQAPSIPGDRPRQRQKVVLTRHGHAAAGYLGERERSRDQASLLKCHKGHREASLVHLVQSIYGKFRGEPAIR